MEVPYSSLPRWSLGFVTPKSCVHLLAYMYMYQGLSQLSGLRRQFVPSRPLVGDKWEKLGDKIFFYHYSKCNINNNMFFSTN